MRRGCTRGEVEQAAFALHISRGHRPRELEQAVDELQQRALAGAAAADEGHDFTGVDGEVEVTEDGRPTWPRERDVAELESSHGRTAATWRIASAAGSTSNQPRLM